MQTGDRAGDRADPVETARSLVAERFPAAACAFLGGTVLTAHRTATSDLDVVVVVPDGEPAPFRETVRYAGWVAELFVHDRSSLDHYFGKDVALRRPALVSMVAGGVVLADRAGVAAEVQDCARRLLEQGPAPLSDAKLRRWRYALSDLLDDLDGARDADERMIVGMRVLAEAAELALHSAGSWTGTGKWLVRRLRSDCPADADALLSGFRTLVREGQVGPLAAAAAAVLERAGGRLMEGFTERGEGADAEPAREERPDGKRASPDRGPG